MVGGIYTDEKCPICKKQMVDNKKSAVKGGAVACPSHPKQRAQRLRVVIKMDGKLIRRRFTDYSEAEHFLNGLRYEIGNNKFDPREFEKDDPLAFARWPKPGWRAKG